MSSLSCIDRIPLSLCYVVCVCGRTWAFKCMQKQRIVATKQQANVMREKTLLAQARHPFLLRLEATMQDQNCLPVSLSLSTEISSQLPTHHLFLY